MKTMTFLRSSALAVTGLVLAACSEPPGATPEEARIDPQTPAATSAPAGHPILTVYKSPACGCCEQWVFHLADHDFQTRVKDTDRLPEWKQKLGVGSRFQSCHTAVDEKSGYVFEGHVPASVIRQFLAEKPADAIGLAVPGMPIGSPGMERGDYFEPHDVLVMQKDGGSRIYVHIDAGNPEGLRKAGRRQP